VVTLPLRVVMIVRTPLMRTVWVVAFGFAAGLELSLLELSLLDDAPFSARLRAMVSPRVNGASAWWADNSHHGGSDRPVKRQPAKFQPTSNQVVFFNQEIF